MASKKIFTNRDGRRELAITRMGQGAMLFEITDSSSSQKSSISILLTNPDLSDLQRDIYAYLNFSKNV